MIHQLQQQQQSYVVIVSSWTYSLCVWVQIMCSTECITCHNSSSNWINYNPQLGSTMVILLPYVVPKSYCCDRIHYRWCVSMKCPFSFSSTEIAPLWSLWYSNIKVLPELKIPKYIKAPFQLRVWFCYNY